MSHPRVFVSAVSEELRTARQFVAGNLRRLGFDPVSQEDFSTGHGELRQWLCDQMNSCTGFIQLVGSGYGQEPPLDPAYGRVSYVQFEFLYAAKQRKKTWVITVGDEFSRDQQVDELDLPTDQAHPDPKGHQAERRELQKQYLERIRKENHLRHHADSYTELENIVLRLRDDLGRLRKAEDGRRRRLMGTVVAVLVGIVVLGAGGWWGYHQLSGEVRATHRILAGVAGTSSACETKLA